MGSIVLARKKTRTGSNVVSAAILEGLDDLPRLSDGIEPNFSGGETSESKEDKSCVSVCPDADVPGEACSDCSNGNESSDTLGRRGSSRRCFPSLEA